MIVSESAERNKPATNDRYRKVVERMFAAADIQINGGRPFDVRVMQPGFYSRIIADAQLGLGESYMDGWWECDAIDEMTRRFIAAGLHKTSLKNLRYAGEYLLAKMGGIGRKSKAFEVGEKHYDLGNDLFRVMLDSRMIYSCAYWKGSGTLEEAQENKLDLVCRKVGLRPGLRVLEIGCGWGGWAKYAAEKYGVEVVGVTVSKQQCEFARKSCSGLPVEVRLQDYRELNEKFDRVVSIAMFEAVGQKYYRTFMKVVDRCLKDDGLFLLHTIVGNEPVGAAEAPWLNRYIFPNGELPSLSQITRAAEGLFITEACHRLGSDYDRTLACWYDNFIRNWSQISSSYDQRFFRMWTFYLQIARGIFQSRIAHLWQMVFSKHGIRGLAAADLDRGFDFYESR